MTPHQIMTRAKFLDYTSAGSTDAATLYPNRQFDVVRLISAGAETRTLARPLRSGLFITLNMVTDGGDITVTVTGAYDETGTTTMVFNDTGDFAIFESMEEGSGTYVWRLIRSEGVTGPVQIGGSLSLAGTLAVTGATTLTGAATVGAIVQAPVFVADATPYTVLAANSGKLHIILEQANSITLNLPVIAAGLSYKFIMGGVATEAQNWVIVATTPSFYNGGVSWDDSNAVASPVPVYANGTSHLTLTATTPEAGTAIEIYSNGTEWFVCGAVFSVATPAFT